MCSHPHFIQSRSLISPKNGCGVHLKSRGGVENRASNRRSSSTSAANSTGLVPSFIWSTSGIVGVPRVHINGESSATHLTSLPIHIGFPDSARSPITPRNESQRWQTAWCAFIFPHCRALSARKFPSRLKIICRSASTPRLPFLIVLHLPSLFSTTSPDDRPRFCRGVPSGRPGTQHKSSNRSRLQTISRPIKIFPHHGTFSRPKSFYP